MWTTPPATTGTSAWNAKSQGDTTGPVRTIAKALRLAQAGDRIELAKSEQPYRECVSLVGTRHSAGRRRLRPRRQRGHAGRLRADPRGGLDLFSRQYLPLPTQKLEAGPSCSSTAVPSRRCRWPRDRLPAEAGTAPVVRDAGALYFAVGTEPAAARLQVRLRGTAHRHHALPGRSGRDSQRRDPGLSGGRRGSGGRPPRRAAGERHLHGQRPERR